MSAASRRRRWFATGFGHLGPLVRPRYKRTSVEKQKRRLAELIATEKRIKTKKK